VPTGLYELPNERKVVMTGRRLHYGADRDAEERKREYQNGEEYEESDHKNKYTLRTSGNGVSLFDQDRRGEDESLCDEKESTHER